MCAGWIEPRGHRRDQAGLPEVQPRRAQDFGPRIRKANGRNGIEVFKAAGVSVENLTACNFLEGGGSSGNEIWFNFGDGSGKRARRVPGRLSQRDVHVLRHR